MSGAHTGFGWMPANAPPIPQGDAQVLRLLVLGDFSGRALAGRVRGAADLADTQVAQLDIDTIDDVIAGFATTLELPLEHGGNLAVPLADLDDLHPDALATNVGLFQDLSVLRQRLSSGAGADGVMQALQDWARQHQRPLRQTFSSPAVMPPARRLSDFEALIGGAARPAPVSDPAQDLIARVVGPHVVADITPAHEAALEAIDAALSDAMRLVLHHPGFQAHEAGWRMLDFLARRIETGPDLEILVADVSAEELASDLATAEDLSQSGLFGLLRQVAVQRGGLSAVAGLYSFDETPAHGDLLGRLARIAAHAGVPFLSAMAAGVIARPADERPPLILSGWQALGALPAARYLGLVAPGFMLRHPYGRGSDPIESFRFEEFSREAGLKSFLWANPAVLVLVLMAMGFRQNGPGLSMGRVMALGDIPLFWARDRHGDQVAFPCTGHNLSQHGLDAVARRCIMPVLWLKGRDQIRLGAFQSVAGKPLAGPWAPAACPPDPGPPPPPDPAEETDAADETVDEIDAEIDALLAGFDADTDMDPELAALLESLE